MRGEDEQLMKRLDELAARAARTGFACFTPFLSPAEAQWAQASANRQRVNLSFQGGFEDAERCIGCFWDDEEPVAFPLTALELTWPHQSAPGHRDVLGSVMGLESSAPARAILCFWRTEDICFARKPWRIILPCR